MTDTPPAVRRWLAAADDEGTFLLETGWGGGQVRESEEVVLASDHDAALAALKEQLEMVTSDRDAKTKRMWELGIECDALESELVEAKAKVGEAREIIEGMLNTSGTPLIADEAEWTAVTDRASSWLSPQTNQGEKPKGDV